MDKMMILRTSQVDMAHKFQRSSEFSDCIILCGQYALEENTSEEYATPVLP